MNYIIAFILIGFSAMGFAQSNRDSQIDHVLAQAQELRNSYKEKVSETEYNNAHKCLKEHWKPPYMPLSYITGRELGVSKTTFDFFEQLERIADPLRPTLEEAEQKLLKKGIKRCPRTGCLQTTGSIRGVTPQLEEFYRKFLGEPDQKARKSNPLLIFLSKYLHLT